jgi:hypothetical protein
MLLLITLLFGLLLIAAACGDDDDDGDGAPTRTASATAPASASATAGATPAEEPAIVIDAPTASSTVQVPFEASGSANVFEAALVVELKDAAGALLCRRFVQATSGTGTRGTWETTLAVPPPAADSPVTLRALSYSPRDGAEENIVERPLTLSAEAPDIVIEEPDCNATFTKSDTLQASGNAQVFEAALTVELRDANGNVVLTQNVTAADGTQRSPWTAALDLSDPAVLPGLYELVALSFSAEDGTVENEFGVPVTVFEADPQ